MSSIIDKISSDVLIGSNDTLKVIFEKVMDKKALTSFLLTCQDEYITITFEKTKLVTEKMRMYNYLNGVLIPLLVKVKKDNGELVDKAECLLQMKALFAKDVIKDKDGNFTLVLLSQSDMNKQRLLTFITDVINHLEVDYEVEAPDSHEYKLMLLNKIENRKYKQVK
jgi:hypothetical protein